MKKEDHSINNFSRREFVKVASATAGGFMLGSLPLATGAYAAGSDTLKLALIGCGNRGSGAVFNALNSNEGVKLVAMADILEERVNESYTNLSQRFGGTGKLDVPPERRLVGFDAYKQVMEGADVVLLATPTFFRPLHYAEAVKQGKHIFMEKPVAVDAMGVRSVLETGKIAKQKNLKVVVGLQRRYDSGYRDLYRQIQNGAIGEIMAAQVYWLQGPGGIRVRQPHWTELEHQIKNHFHFIWLAGDQVLDQMIHNLDVANWYLGEHPVSAQGMGGREVPKGGTEYGQIFDHSAIEYTYPSGLVLSAMCRQMAGCYGLVAERFQGNEGTLTTGGPWGVKITDRKNNDKFVYERREDDPNPYDWEHVELINAIRNDIPLNDTESAANSTFTSVMGFMAAYSGQLLTWDEALQSNLKLYPDHGYHPEEFNWDTPPPVMPDEDGNYPVPVPGVTVVI